MAEEEWLRIAEFVDRFRGADEKKRMELMRAPPADSGDAVIGAYWAATVESLCMERGIAPPAWVNERRFFLKTPFFAGGMEFLKALLLIESPVPFRRRNIFVSSNALSRA